MFSSWAATYNIRRGERKKFLEIAAKSLPPLIAYSPQPAVCVAKHGDKNRRANQRGDGTNRKFGANVAGKAHQRAGRRVAQKQEDSPPTTEAGSSIRWSGPTMRRMMWGATNPTNPIAPQKETVSPTVSEPSR